jgi:SAM-dependent methyltransferase
MPHDARDAHVEHLRRVLHSFFLQAPLLARGFRKPRGYAGDYEMMNMAYRDAAEGDTPLGCILHAWINGLRPSCAVRSRRTWLLDRLHEHASERATARYRVASIACGPAQELQDLAHGSPLAPFVDATCLDQDDEALAFARARLDEACAKAASAMRVTTLPLGVKDLLTRSRSRAEAPPLAEQDFIYSMGLYDYLPERVASALTRALYDRLAPGGRLVVGNFVPCADTRFVMESVMDWHLIYRTPEALLALGRALPASAKAAFADEPTGLNGFLVVDRPR